MENDNVTNNNFNNGMVMMPATPAQVPLNCDQAMNVTTITDLQSYVQGTVIRFPDFSEGQPLVARVRRPSMMALAKQGKIPNALLKSANTLFTGNEEQASNGNDDGMLKEMYEICHIVCESALISPTLEEIESVGLELSDEQIMAIFNYTQTGVKALDSFRTE